MRRAPLGLLAVLVLAGCTGKIRDTTTARTAEEQLLCSTAAERAVGRLDSRTWAGRAVFVDAERLQSIDRGFVVSAFDQSVSEAGGRLVKDRAKADITVEVRSAALGQWDGKWRLWVPLESMPLPGGRPADSPGIIEIGYSLREGWCRLDAFAIDAQGQFVRGWRDNWGRAYVGFFDDIYPSSAIAETVQAKFQ